MSRKYIKLKGDEEFVFIKPSKKSKKKKEEKKKSKKKDAITGIYTANAKGFGFVTVEGYTDDFFIPAKKTNGAMQGDEVSIKVIAFGKGGKRTEAEVIEILNHGLTRIVGTYKQSKNFGFVVSDNLKVATDLYIPQGESMGAMEGHKVVAEITKYADACRKPEGRVVEILGHVTDPGVDISAIVKSFEIPMEFPKEVMKEAEAIGLTVPSEAVKGRNDLRDVTMVTIDGEDAKDLDDAVSLSVEDGIYYLGVHIADVSEYVKEGSPLDKEAYNRGTSVYLADRVIPMLPRRLSNGICSLNAGEDRLAMTCEMKIGKDGQILSYHISESVIHVTKRMNYTDVNAMLHGETKEEYEFLRPMFEEMYDLSQILWKKRRARGCIDFDLPEAKILLDEKGHAIDVTMHEHNDATHLIEEFMLAANECVAAYMLERDYPFLYRVHEQPAADKIMDLQILARSFGYHLPGDAEDIKPADIQELMEGIKGREEEKFISTLALRSMRQARYTNTCLGHFGLACKEYTHFTSPIRRYPDLQIHRILKEQLRGKLTEKKIAHYDKILESVGDQCSKRERRSIEAEREVDKLKKAEYMGDRIGESFDGVISGVTAWGFYVELPNTVEGLVPINKLYGDIFEYREGRYEIKGLNHHMVYKLGEPITIVVNSVDLQSRTIEFLPPLPDGVTIDQLEKPIHVAVKNSKKKELKKAHRKGSSKGKSSGKKTEPSKKVKSEKKSKKS